MKRFIIRAAVCTLFVMLASLVWITKPLPRPLPQLQSTVVKIEVENKYGSRWEGSGVFIADDLILTAGHMVDYADDVWIIWPDGRRHRAMNWYMESEADLGVIYVGTPGIESKAKFDDAVIGEEVWALGNSLGIFPILTKGIVSAIDMPDDYMNQKNMIITDTAINPGNSGCPLFDKDGNILGICSWGYNYSQGMSYFVRAEICELMLDKYYATMALEDVE